MEIELNISDNERKKSKHELNNDHSNRIRKSSSLKSGKKLPGTPERKKIVRFADYIGLDLTNIRIFLDEIRKNRESTYLDLAYENITENKHLQHQDNSNKKFKVIVPMFQQPVDFHIFLYRLREIKVCLENIMVTRDLSIKGTVRVLNLDFCKSVFLRYTLDNWTTFSDLHGYYVQDSCDSFSDKFQFTLFDTRRLKIGQRMLFAICSLRSSILG